MTRRLLAIHDGIAWNAKWIAHCRAQGIPHRVVDCLRTDIMEQLRDCWGLMWLFHHMAPAHILMARAVLNAASAAGLRVFPDHQTCAHFDDKLAQKYVFDALALPVPATWVFFDRQEAMDFVDSCALPVVGKLRRGAGSYNVRLLPTRRAARAYVRRMFGRGYSPAPHVLADARNKLQVAATHGWKGIGARLRKAPRFFRIVTHARRFLAREKGYVYLQEFLPGNDCDIRISVVGDRAWGFRRIVRKRDFRASGSGVIDYDPTKIPMQLVSQSFAAARALRMQSACFDWVRREDGAYRFVEVSMGFVDEAVYTCDGYWDRARNWHKGHLSPAVAALEDLLAGRNAEAPNHAGPETT